MHKQCTYCLNELWYTWMKRKKKKSTSVGAEFGVNTTLWSCESFIFAKWVVFNSRETQSTIFPVESNKYKKKIYKLVIINKKIIL